MGESSEQREIYVAAISLQVVFSRSCAHASIYRVLFSELFPIAIASSPWLLAKSLILNYPIVVDRVWSTSLQIDDFHTLQWGQLCFAWFLDL